MAWIPKDLQEQLQWATDSLQALLRRVEFDVNPNDLGHLADQIVEAKKRLKCLQRKAARIHRREWSL